VKQQVSRRLIVEGLAVTNWSDCVSETVAEAALLLVLSALRRSHYHARLMHVERGWHYPPSGALSLFDRRVGIHGFGAIARRLIPLLRPFRTPISVFSTGVPAEHYSAHGVIQCASLESLFASSDVLVELEALTVGARGIVSEELLRLLPPGATFVNLGRGALVDEAGLARLAAEGRIRLALDVYATEPLPVNSALRDIPEVVLFPHQGGPTEDRGYLCGDFALANLERYLRGEPLEGQVTLEVYDRST
jgi:phosphoglycerate dehydrogenase-like enzyme